MPKTVEYIEEVNRLHRATAKYDRLLQSGDLSVPQDLGYVAVICSTDSVDGTRPPIDSNGANQIGWFKTEAANLTDGLTKQGKTVEKIITTSINDVTLALQDEYCTDVVVIGNGSYSRLWLADSHLSWWNVSKSSNHLKTGRFVQRTCGHFQNDRVNVSLGTFLMADQTSIYAAVGEQIDDATPDESKFVQVYPQGDITAHALIAKDVLARKKSPNLYKSTPVM